MYDVYATAESGRKVRILKCCTCGGLEGSNFYTGTWSINVQRFKLSAVQVGLTSDSEGSVPVDIYTWAFAGDGQRIVAPTPQNLGLVSHT